MEPTRWCDFRIVDVLLCVSAFEVLRFSSSTHRSTVSYIINLPVHFNQHSEDILRAHLAEIAELSDWCTYLTSVISVKHVFH